MEGGKSHSILRLQLMTTTDQKHPFSNSNSNLQLHYANITSWPRRAKERRSILTTAVPPREPSQLVGESHTTERGTVFSLTAQTNAARKSIFSLLSRLPNGTPAESRSLRWCTTRQGLSSAPMVTEKPVISAECDCLR